MDEKWVMSGVDGLVCWLDYHPRGGVRTKERKIFTSSSQLTVWPEEKPSGSKEVIDQDQSEMREVKDERVKETNPS